MSTDPHELEYPSAPHTLAAGEQPGDALLGDLLALSVEPVEPRVALRERILGAAAREPVHAVGGAPAPAQSAPGAEWAPFLPGITQRRLHRTRAGYESQLLRMQAGARLPAHPHAGVEELCVLSGDCAFDGQHLRAGDYFQMPAGSIHAEIQTSRGCVVLVMSHPRE